MPNGEHKQLQFSFTPVVVPQGDGSFLVRPGKVIVNGVLRVREVAQRLDVTEQHVLNLIESGEINATDVSGGKGRRRHWRIAVADLEAFVQARSSLRG